MGRNKLNALGMKIKYLKTFIMQKSRIAINN